MDYNQKSLKLHEELKGKIEVISRVKVDDAESLATAYTPGVAAPTLEISKTPKTHTFIRGAGILSRSCRTAARFWGLETLAVFPQCLLWKGNAYCLRNSARRRVSDLS